MAELILNTFDWVPELPRGFVRDLRIRWALEEAGLSYRVVGVPFENRGPEHFAHQPFGQVPWLTDGDLSIFETGAILLHLAERSEVLMTKDPRGRSAVVQWLFAALNSVEMAVLPWALFNFSNVPEDAPGRSILDDFVKIRLDRLEAYLAGREWLTGPFTVADLLMADVLRLVDRFEGWTGQSACRDFVARATARPAFKKALGDQMAFFAEADRVRRSPTRD
jgi:glutathione S-transferase